MNDPKLFMLLLGCQPPGRWTEQHDLFFGIAGSLKELVPAIRDFWPEAGENLHIDVWREVTEINGHTITIRPRTTVAPAEKRLFFLNLGGYKKGDFEEYHYKMLVVAKNSTEAVEKAKRTAFFRHTGFTGAPSHIDDKYGLDVDDVYDVADMLNANLKEQYELVITENDGFCDADQLHAGYLLIKTFEVL